MSAFSMQRSCLTHCAVSAVVALFLLSGCKPSGYSGPTGTVSGKVTLDGKPAPAGCSVAFISDKGFTAVGSVGAEGSYSLSTTGSPQIPVSSYKVSVSAPGAGAMSDADYEKYMSGSGGADASQAQAAPPAVPPKFADPTTSGLSFEVKEGPNTIDIDLK